MNTIIDYRRKLGKSALLCTIRVLWQKTRSLGRVYCTPKELFPSFQGGMHEDTRPLMECGHYTRIIG